MTNDLCLEDVKKASRRIKNHIKNTPLISNEIINEKLGAQLFFKMENQQVTKSFKARGAFNAILEYEEKYGHLPEKIVASSSGNHAQAIAHVCKEFGLEAKIHMMAKASQFKIAATQKLGAKVILHEKRANADQEAKQDGENGYFFVHPSMSDEVICGQGTATLEAAEKLNKENIKIDAIFTPCGGGGLLSGALVAAKAFKEEPQVWGCEPKNANDAILSLKNGKIFKFEDTPQSIADGARTLAITENTFKYLKKTNGILAIEEELIKSAQEELVEILGEKIEPTSALAFTGAKQFLQKNKNLQNLKILIIISGGNYQ